jgi:hypothetical protein
VGDAVLGVFFGWERFKVAPGECGYNAFCVEVLCGSGS